MTIRKLTLPLCLLTFLTSLGACQGTSHQAVDGAAPPPLIACSNMLHPPFSSWDETGRAVGIEVDLIAEAARRLGREVTWVERPFIELLPAVVFGEADVAASTIGITEERARTVAFSASYYQTSIVALVRFGDDEPLCLADLAGRRVAAERGTTAVGAAQSAIPDAKLILERPDERGWPELLAAGEIDAIVLDESHAETYMTQAGLRFAIVEEPLRTESFALAVHPDAYELLAALDEVIAEQ